MWRGVFFSIKREKGQKRCGERRIDARLFCPVGDRSLALRVEYRIKQLTKRQKERLVTGDGSFEALCESLIRSD